MQRTVACTARNAPSQKAQKPRAKTALTAADYTGLAVNATWSFHVGPNWILPGQSAILFRENFRDMPRQWPRGGGGVM